MMSISTSSVPPGSVKDAKTAIQRCEALAEARDRLEAQRTGIEIEVHYGSNPQVLVAVARMYLETGLLSDAKRALSIAARVLATEKAASSPSAPELTPPKLPDASYEDEEDPTIVIRAPSTHPELPVGTSAFDEEEERTLHRGLPAESYPTQRRLQKAAHWLRRRLERIGSSYPALIRISQRPLRAIGPLRQRWLPITAIALFVVLGFLGCAQLNHHAEHRARARVLAQIGASLASASPASLETSREPLDRSYELGLFESTTNLFVESLSLPANWGYEAQLPEASTLRIKRTLLLSLYDEDAIAALRRVVTDERANQPRAGTLAAAELWFILNDPLMTPRQVTEHIGKHDATAEQDALFQLISGVALSKIGNPGASARFSKAKDLDEGLLLADALKVQWVLLSEGFSSGKPLLEEFTTAVEDVPHLASATKALEALAWAKTADRKGEPPADLEPSTQERALLPVVLEDAVYLSDAAKILIEHAEDRDSLSRRMSNLIGQARSAELLASIGRLVRRHGYDKLAEKALGRGRSLIRDDHAGLDYLELVLKLTRGKFSEARRLASRAQVPAAAAAVVAYERLDDAAFEQNDENLQEEIKGRPELAPLAQAEKLLAGELKELPEAIGAGLWSDLLSVDMALDRGDLKSAMRLMAGWPSTDDRPMHRLRRARLARYQGKLTLSLKLSQSALKDSPESARALIEHVYALIAAGRAEDARGVLQQYPSLIQPVKKWMDGLLLAKTKGWVAAAGKVSYLPLPRSINLIYRTVIARATASAGDPRARMVVRDAKTRAGNHPDVLTAISEL